MHFSPRRGAKTLNPMFWLAGCLLLIFQMAATAHGATTLTPTGLVATGDGQTLFLCVPEISPHGHAEFSILYHRANHRSGAGDLWQRLYSAPLVGHPACISALHISARRPGLSSMAALFGSGTGWVFSTAGKLALPPLPAGFVPRSACGSGKGLMVIGRSLAASPSKTPPSPHSAPPQSQPAAQAATKPASAKPGLTAGRSQTPTVAAQAATRPITKPIAAATPEILWLDGNQWRVILLPAAATGLAASHHFVLVYRAGKWWLFANPVSAHSSVWCFRASWLKSRLVWQAPFSVTVGKGLRHIFEIAVHRGVVLMVGAPLPQNSVRIAGGFIPASGAAARFISWPKTIILKNMHLSSPLTDIALGRDGDCVTTILLAPHGNIQSMTLGSRGNIIYSLAAVSVQKLPQHHSQNFPQYIVLGIVALLIFSLWQRKGTTPPDKNAIYRIALLRWRFLAALIDMALAAIIVAVVFKLYTWAAWQPVFNAAENLITRPGLLFSTPELLMWLSIYELQVMIGEAVVGRSIGKALMGLRVCDMTGKPAGPLPVLLRNIIRIPEMLLIVLLIFMFVSEERQRLGDLIARTVVIQRKK